MSYFKAEMNEIRLHADGALPQIPLGKFAALPQIC